MSRTLDLHNKVFGVTAIGKTCEVKEAVHGC